MLSRFTFKHYRHFGVNLPSLKERINSTKKIRNVCESMRSIAASKIKGAIDTCDRSKCFTHSFLPIWNSHNPTPPKKHLLLVVTSNFGLCGSSNINVIRRAEEYINEHLLSAGKSFRIGFIGNRGKRTMENGRFKNKIAFNVEALHEAGVFTLENAGELAQKFVLKEEFDQLDVFHNLFISKVKSGTITSTMQSRERSLAHRPQMDHYEIDILGSEDNMHMSNLYDASLASLIYSAVVGNVAVEQNTRFLSMTNAVNNIDEMVKDMQIKYNAARQDSITTEICEINAGKMAVMLQLKEDE